MISDLWSAELWLEVNWARGETGWSGLHYAAWCNFGDLLELLLAQAGVNTNIQAQTQTWSRVRHV